MRKVFLPLLASLAVASPALANESRVEARGGVIWDGGDSEAIAGVALGYDFDLGSAAFVGAEVSADQTLESNMRDSSGTRGRLGANLSLCEDSSRRDAEQRRRGAAADRNETGLLPHCRRPEADEGFHGHG